MGQNEEGDCYTLAKTEKVDRDSIDRLPDDILIQILSSLPVNEAPRTSVLSSRWRHLWTHMTSLNCICLGSGCKNSMESICSSIQSPSIENLRMIAHDDYDQAIADGWVRFALDKKVKNIELIRITSSFRLMLSFPAAKHLKSLTLTDISISRRTLKRVLANCTALEHLSMENLTTLRSLRVGNSHRGPYQQLNLKILKVFHCVDLRNIWISAPRLSEFQYEGRAISFHIEIVPSLCRVYLVGGLFRDILSCPAAKHLKSLTLTDISISGEYLERVLANCTELEHVSIEKLRTLTSLRVGDRLRDPSQQLNLKSLKVFNCVDLSDLWISAPRLSEFRYEGQKISFHIDNVPSLCRVYLVGGLFDDCVNWAFRALPGYLCQLQTLVLRCSTLSDMNFLRSGQLELFSLRKLTLRISGPDDANLLNLLFLLDAAPNLAQFRFESDITSNNYLERTIIPRPHQNLKMLEFVGCIDHKNVLNFIRCVISAAPNLEKVTFDTKGKFQTGMGEPININQPGLRIGLMSC